MELEIKMKWSFYQFGELVNEHKQQITEGNPQGAFSQYGGSANPHLDDRAIGDGYGSKQDVETEEQRKARAAQKKAGIAGWKSKNPELAAATSAVNADNRRVDPQAQFDQEVTRRGGRVGQVIRDSTPLNKLEKALEGDNSESGKMAKQINDFIYNNQEEFANKNLTKREWGKFVVESMPMGGVQSPQEWNKMIAMGLTKLIQISPTLLIPSEENPGTYEMNVEVLSSKGSRGHDTMGDLVDKHGGTFLKSANDVFNKNFKKLMSLKRELGTKDKKTIDAAKAVVDSGQAIMKQSTSDFESIKKYFNYASKIAYPSNIRDE